MGCIVKCNRHGFLALRLFWNGMRSWEGTGLLDTAENRKLLEAAALVITSEINNQTFDYLKHFPKGNKGPPVPAGGVSLPFSCHRRSLLQGMDQKTGGARQGTQGKRL